MKDHNYAIAVEWTGNRGMGTSTYAAYSRDYEISSDGKSNVLGSSDPDFRGDKSRYNPEELLVAALSACHMLWVLHLCADRQVVVSAYRDEALGTMSEETDGPGRFVKVVLRPQMRVESTDQFARAADAHRQAHQMCFIANSVNFRVEVEPVFTV